MFVLITEFGEQVQRGTNLIEMLLSFYGYQPNDDISVIIYDITKNRSTKVSYEGARICEDVSSMTSLVESIEWTESYLEDSNEEQESH